MFPVTVVKRFLKRNAPNIPLPPDIDDDLESNSVALRLFPRNLRQLRDHKQDQALTQLLAKHP